MIQAYLRTLHTSLNKGSVIVAVFLALLYLILSVYAVNRAIILDTFFGSLPSAYKITLLQSLLIDSWAIFTPLEAMMLVTIAILMGINITLMGKTLTSLRGKNGLRVSFGGSSMLAVMSAGCPGCGISLLSVLGISSPLLPFQGISLQIVSLGLLSGSLIYLLYKLQQPVTCQVPVK